MAPTRDRSPADDDEQRVGPTALTDRWWWTGVALMLVGVVVIGWQWDVVTKGDAIVATWVVVAIGAVAVVVGAAWLWRDRPRRGDDDAADGPGGPGGPGDQIR